MTYEQFIERVNEQYDLIFGIDYSNQLRYDKDWESMWFEVVRDSDDGRYYFTFFIEDSFMVEVALQKFKEYLTSVGESLEKDKITMLNIYDIDSLTSDMSLNRLYNKLRLLSQGLDKNSHIESDVLSETLATGVSK